MDISSSKLIVAFWGVVSLFSFSLVYAVWYFIYFKKNLFARRLFFWSFGLLSILSLIKAFISIFYKGYIPDRLIFYAVFSPKATGYFWLSFVVFIFLAFINLRKKIECLSPKKFLFAIYLIFILSAVGIASIREGFFGVYEPFTRTEWEYSGNLPLINNVHDFIKNYSNIRSQLAYHSRWHPPGYSIILHFFQKLFNANLAGISLLVIMLGGLAIFPLYYLLKDFASEEEAKRGVQLFAFFPSFLMFDATSMEVAFLFLTSFASALIYFGLKKNVFLAFAGGVVAGFALFSNFLFLLFAPFFILLLWHALKNFDVNKPKIFFRALIAFTALVSFFVFMRLWSGYSVINNFFESYKSNSETVKSNFESLAVYFTYFFMNIIAFAIYLGIPNLFLLIKNFTKFLKEKMLAHLVGFLMIAVFLLIGIFQGEVERIWLFLTPFFVLPLIEATKDFDELKFSSVLSVLFFQVVFMQILFYTYW